MRKTVKCCAKPATDEKVINKNMAKKIATIIIFFLCAGIFCFAQQSLNIIDEKVNFGFRKAENRTITAIIVHSTFNNSGGEQYDINLIIKQFKGYGVSAHYVIGRNGDIYRLTDEKNIAFHAGKSALPNGITAVNECSIGIEIMTSYTESPSPEQITSLVNLVNDIKSRYDVKYLLRHSDIAPGRKTDPWNMDWEGFLEKI
jgi:N-acetyl-anhydromuramyl-L-alanine amidase AmpD